MGVLDNFAREKSKFLKIAENEEVIVTIEDYNEATNMQGEKVIAYKMAIDIDGKEQIKIFQSGSIKLAKAIAELPKEGIEQRVRIKKIGSGFDTKYEVELVK